MSANSDDRPTALWTAKYLATGLAAIVVFLTALLFLPFLTYASLGYFGFPANLVVLVGYIGWLLLRRPSRMLADMCGVAFAIALGIVLTVILFVEPRIVLLILLPSGLVYLGLKAFGYA
jgi:hypothetical protein